MDEVFAQLAREAEASAADRRRPPHPRRQPTDRGKQATARCYRSLEDQVEAQPAGTSLSSLARNFLNSTARCRRGLPLPAISPPWSAIPPPSIPTPQSNGMRRLAAWGPGAPPTSTNLQQRYKQRPYGRERKPDFPPRFTRRRQTFESRRAHARRIVRTLFSTEGHLKRISILHFHTLCSVRVANYTG